MAVRPRISADARRAAIVDAAVAEFARDGYGGATTHAIAARAGVSQPYVVRLFGSKKALFLAVNERCFDRVETAFREAAAAGSQEDALTRMGECYWELLLDRDDLQLQFQSYAACGDPEIRALVGARYAGLYALVGELSGQPREVVQQFFAKGMLLNVAAAIDRPELVDRGDWTRGRPATSAG
jgi:AcrR family transcriptional regulator